jgi:ABC-2 type transport system permease protein
MRFSLAKVGIIARREYLTTVRRKAFVLAIVITPAIFFIAGIVSTKMQIADQVAHQAETRIVALVDSSGVFANAPLVFESQPPTLPSLPTNLDQVKKAAAGETPTHHVPVIMRRYANQAVALDSLAHGDVKQVLVISSDFLATGHVRLYAHDTRAFTNSSDDRALRNWMTKTLLSGQADSVHIERTLWLARGIDYYTQDRDGRWGIKDDARELAGFLLPFAMAFLLAMSILSGGQYLLQGVSEEKETRILESLLCSISPEELMGGKLIGLGSAGLTLVGVWVAAGAFLGGSTMAVMHVSVPPSLLALGFLYFLFGYLFYASLMLGVGSVTSTLREATQYSSYLTILNVCPFWVMYAFLNTPNSALATGMSLFPPTAATSMMLRLSVASVSGAVIPPWQIATSLGLLALSGVLTLLASSKLFRLGMLLYGKAPNLPEIMRILRQA